MVKLTHGILQRENGKKRNCCPLCGSEIVVSLLYQKSYDFDVLKSGKVSKRKRVQECSLETMIANCKNFKCNAEWDEDEFEITEDREFIDYKYDDE